MCESSLKETKSNNSSSGKDYVRILSFCIIGTCSALLLALLWVMVWRASNNNPDVHRVIITTDVLPDSLKAYNYMSREQADSLIEVVRNYDEQLTQKYQYLVEQKEQDSQVFYWGSLIVGIVIAVFGWFGFQSFTTIEDKAKSKADEVAKIVARRTAWNKTKVFLKDQGRNQIWAAAKDNLQKDAVEKTKMQVVNELNTIIDNRLKQFQSSKKVDELEKRLEKLENSYKPEIEKTADAAVKKAFEKYRKPMKGGLNAKENQK